MLNGAVIDRRRAIMGHLAIRLTVPHKGNESNDHRHTYTACTPLYIGTLELCHSSTFSNLHSLKTARMFSWIPWAAVIPIVTYPLV